MAKMERPARLALHKFECRDASPIRFSPASDHPGWSSMMRTQDPCIRQSPFSDHHTREYDSRWKPLIYAEDTCSIAFDGCATLPALRMQGCPAIPSPGRSGVGHPIAFSVAAIPLPPMQRPARRFFLPPETSQEFRNCCRQRYRLEGI